MLRAWLNTRWRGVAVCVLLLSVACTADAQTGQEAKQIVARVNEVEISAARFNLAYVDHLIQTGRNDTPAERYAFLDELINIYLLAEEAAARGLTDAAYDAYVERQVEKYTANQFYHTAFLDSLPDLTEAEIRQAFVNSKDQVYARHLLFGTREQADAAYTRLQAGADFLHLANEIFDTATFDSTAGYLGAADYWVLDDALAEAAYAMPVGAYSEPIRTRYGWHIIRVEDRFRHPLLTESEYQNSRGRTLTQARQRRMRLEGDQFVRSYMENLDVAADRDALRALHDLIQQVTADVGEETPRVNLRDEEVASVRAQLAPEAILATYTLHGERQAFTAQEFARWLPELPYHEVRSRTGAAVGRALRNAVMARAGAAQGLDAHPVVVDMVRYHAALYLANGFREHLRATETATPTEAELREGYERLNLRRLKSAHADYYHIPFETFEAAQSAKDRIIAGVSPDSFEGYAAHTDADLTGRIELSYNLRNAPLRTPVVLGTADGKWHLVRVDARTLTYTEFEEVRPQLEKAMALYLPEIRLVEKLRETATIEVDQALFEDLMQRARPR